jgi:hypothetical protein
MQLEMQGRFCDGKTIVLRNKWKTVELQNPTYSHVLCFSVQKGPDKKDLPDVVVGGPVVDGYCYGTPVCAVKLMFDFLQRWGEPKINQIVDPFVGRGTTLAMAEKYGQRCGRRYRFAAVYLRARAYSCRLRKVFINYFLCPENTSKFTKTTPR